MSNELDFCDDLPAPIRAAIANHFSKVAERGREGPIGELVVFLSSGVLSNDAFAAHIRRHGVANEKWFRGQVIDLALGFIESGMDKGTMTATHHSDVKALNSFLHISDGQFLRYRRAEVAAVLSAQLENILDDAFISEAEEVLQVELQSCFGLGYDDYLSLIRVPFEHSVLDLQLQAGGQGQAALEAKRKLTRIEPMFRLITSQRRTLGGLF